MTTMRVVGECFFWYRLTRVFPDKFHRAVKRLCVCVCSLLSYSMIGWVLQSTSISYNCSSFLKLDVPVTHVRVSKPWMELGALMLPFLGPLIDLISREGCRTYLHKPASLYMYVLSVCWSTAYVIELLLLSCLMLLQWPCVTLAGLWTVCLWSTCKNKKT